MRILRARRIGIGAALIATLLLAASCGMQEDAAKNRVTAVLEGLAKAGGDSRNTYTQTAVCQWAVGAMVIQDEGVMSQASDRFTEWAREKGIYRQIASYEITGTETRTGEYGPEVIVSVKIEGQPLKIRVLKGAPLSWEK